MEAKVKSWELKHGGVNNTVFKDLCCIIDLYRLLIMILSLEKPDKDQTSFWIQVSATIRTKISFKSCPATQPVILSAIFFISKKIAIFFISKKIIQGTSVLRYYIFVRNDTFNNFSSLKRLYKQNFKIM